MERLKNFIVLSIFMIGLAFQMVPAQAYPVTAYTPIYEGMEYATGTATSPRLMRAWAVRVDLKSPWVATCCSPGNGAAAYETALQTTPAFLSQWGIKAAINTSFFDANLSPNTDIWGLLISGTNVVSGPYAAPFDSQLTITPAKVPNLACSGSIPSGIQDAFAGSYIILSNGAITVGDDDVNPRSGVGYSQDKRYFIMVVVDGRQPGWSDGTGYGGLAQWLKDFGAWDGLSLDGGGSTCLSVAGMGSYVNRPCYGYARAVGANFGFGSSNYINPSYLFDADTQHWTLGGGASGLNWAGGGWNGSLYFDQTGNDASIYSGTTNFGGPWNGQTINVNVYPQNGTTSAHDMQAFWKTTAENFFDSAKSTPVVNFTAQNAWATVNLFINSPKWWGQTINQLRLDVDNTNHGNRWIINHVVKQSTLWYHFAYDTMGWTATGSLTPTWWISDGQWPGCLVTDQTGNDANMLGPAIPVNGDFPFNYIGGSNDRLHVRVYPQNGTTTSHDMAVYWIHAGDTTWNQAKHVAVNYTGKNQWVDVYLPVGTNANWATKHITQLRLDFDSTNHGNRWIVDYITIDY